jgi:hypothetical protein
MSEATETPVATKPKKEKTRKAKVAKPKAAKAKAPKAPKPRQEKAEREDRSDWKTFALRMPSSESAALHKAAGPANASKVMRALAGAFVTGDRAAFEAIVEDAKKLRA